MPGAGSRRTAGATWSVGQHRRIGSTADGWSSPCGGLGLRSRAAGGLDYWCRDPKPRWSRKFRRRATARCAAAGWRAGTQREPVALLIATHLALCPQCRDQTCKLEAIGGALLEQLGPESPAEDGFARLLDRLDEPEGPAAAQRPDLTPGYGPRLPQPLRDHVGGSLNRLRWRRLGPIAPARLLTGCAGFTTRLVRLCAGAGAPGHTHEGTELTLVLEGGFTDASGHYLRGDVEVADSAVDHRPVADADGDCLCLAVADAPLRLTGRLGRLLNPFVRM